MIFSLLTGSSISDILISLLLLLPGMILALSLHETAHGYVAWKLGDPTAYSLGRLTLNPLKHLDPLGFLALLVFGFGWAKPVPINSRYFQNPRRDMALAALAGPASNLLLGVLFSLLYGIMTGLLAKGVYGESLLLFKCLYWGAMLFMYGAIINFIYMTFNMIPVPPFDGSRFALLFLPQRIYFGIMRYERQIMYSILIVLFLLSRFLNFSPFSWVAQNLTRLIAGVVLRLFL